MKFKMSDAATLKLNFAHPKLSGWSLVIVCALVLAGCDARTPNQQAIEIVVHKSATCGCCKEWMNYLEDEGFTVRGVDHDDMDAVKLELGLPDAKLKSCHTAVTSGYIIEGHVPANDIRRLLQQKPADVIGLSAPGMPMMSPGMASREPKDYAVLSFDENGVVKVFSEY